MILRAWRARLPGWIGIGVQSLDNPPLPWPGESLSSGAVAVRRREFAAGRAAARQALARAGLVATAIPAGPDRAPLWPDGATGSISHSRHIAVALASDIRHTCGIGVDTEPALPLQADLRAEIVGPDDRLSGADLPDLVAARLCFSVKETVFKAQFPLTRRWLDFRDIAVGLTPAGFTVSGTGLTGGWISVSGQLISWLIAAPEQQGELCSLGPHVMARERPLPGSVAHGLQRLARG